MGVFEIILCAVLTVFGALVFLVSIGLPLIAIGMVSFDLIKGAIPKTQGPPDDKKEDR